jgi:hypothetical protein
LASFEDIWREQCEAARTIRTRYGDKAAFDYLIGEKLLRFMAEAKDRPEFARRLPAFFSEVRTTFPASAIEARLNGLQARLAEDARDQDEFDPDWPNAAASDLALLRQISDLLRAPRVGTA